jgi:hypothetical protein
LVFGMDLGLAFPFKGVSVVMDVTMLVSAVILGLLSWLTLREQ